MHPGPDDQVGRLASNKPSQVSPNEVRADLNQVQQLPTTSTGTAASSRGFMSTKLIGLLALLIVVGVAAAVVPAVLVSLSQTTVTTGEIFIDPFRTQVSVHESLI